MPTPTFYIIFSMIFVIVKPKEKLLTTFEKCMIWLVYFAFGSFYLLFVYCIFVTNLSLKKENKLRWLDVWDEENVCVSYWWEWIIDLKFSIRFVLIKVVNRYLEFKLLPEMLFLDLRDTHISGYSLRACSFMFPRDHNSFSWQRRFRFSKVNRDYDRRWKRLDENL